MTKSQVSPPEELVPDELRAYLDKPKIREAFDSRMELMALGKSIRDKRKAAGLTQEQLAELIGMNQPDIVRIEHGLGKHGPTMQTLLRLAEALNSRMVVTFETLPTSGPQKATPHASRLEIGDVDIASVSSLAHL